MRVAVFLLFPAILPAADTLVLRSGPPVSGTYEGGDARSIRFVVGDQVKVYPISDVVSIQFDNPTAGQGTGVAGSRFPSVAVWTENSTLAFRRPFPGGLEAAESADTSLVCIWPSFEVHNRARSFRIVQENQERPTLVHASLSLDTGERTRTAVPIRGA